MAIYDHKDNIIGASSFSLKKNLLLESFQRQQFDDKPDHYIVWKTQFRVMASDIKCSPLEEITLLTSCISRNTDAYRLVMSVRSACARDPGHCLILIWARMDEMFGSPELIESALKSRILNLPDSLYNKKLYDLFDLLTEIQAVKDLPQFGAIFAYLDSSLGLRPIIQKLPRHIQDKWISRVVGYKKLNDILFPPFSEFVNFIGEISTIKNDSGLNFRLTKESVNARGKVSMNNMKRYVASHKTDIITRYGNAKKICLIHTGSKHTINQCNAFRGKSIQERKELLKSRNVCLRCCETTEHFANKCNVQIQCNICKSDRHSTALHVPQEVLQMTSNSRQGTMQNHGEEKSPSGSVTVKSSCTEVCGIFRAKSCARIVPVRVYKTGHRENSVSGFAMLDDQSNKTLGKGSLFDMLDMHSRLVKYTMQSCSGKFITHGRIAEGLVVEGSDKYEMNLPPVLECDNLPENEAEIPTSNVAKHFNHMRDIAQYLPDSDSDMKIILLIGRDLPNAHHVIDQRNGPPQSPFAQRSPLGWTIIGDVCLSGQHVSSANVYKTFICKSGRPTTLEPCQQIVSISDGLMNTSKTQVTRLNIFETNNDDNKPGLSMDDRQFLEIMDKEFHIGLDRKWTAPLPFRSLKQPISDNFNMALNRARSLDYSLNRNTQKREHFMAFMQKILDYNHAELAPDIPPDKERSYLPLFGVNSFKSKDIAKGLVNLDFEKDILSQRNLGLLWDLGSDTFKFTIAADEKPATRRGILSVVNSLFDPLGFISPVSICGKIILRKIVAIRVDWDEPLSENELQEWHIWKGNLHHLERFQIPRVIVPNLSDTISRELLTFCDASELAISAASYLQATYPDNSTSIGFVFGKSKVAPRSGNTIPRLELCAAVLAIEVSQIAIEHLQLDLQQVKFLVIVASY